MFAISSPRLRPGDLVEGNILWHDIEKIPMYSGWRMLNEATNLCTLALVVAVTGRLGGREDDQSRPRAIIIVCEDRTYWTWDYHLRRL